MAPAGADDDEPDTEQLRVEQTARARRERRAAEAAGEPGEEHTHDRRAERAAYLASRLAERERSELETEPDDTVD